MKYLLITGGAGFIGANLVHYILENTNYHILNVDKLSYAGNKHSLYNALDNPRHNLFELDINNKSKLEEILKIYKPTAIIHLAAESHVDRSIDTPDAFMHTNIYGTYQILEAVRSYWNQLSTRLQEEFRLLHISTDEIYGDLDLDAPSFTEESNYHPNSPYSATKAASDHLMRAWARTFQLPIIVTNCSNNYGPYQFPEKLIPHTILSALSGKELSIYGDGMQIRDWLYVKDHIRALLLVMEKGKVGSTYNIGSNNDQYNITTVNKVCDLLEELAPDNKPKNINYYSDLINFVEDRPGHDRRYSIDANKISRELNWRPLENFEEGLRKTVNWYLNNKSWWRFILNKSYRLKRLGINQNNNV